MRQLAVALAVFFCTLLCFQVSSPAQFQGEHARKVLAKVDPLYPDLARRMKMQGTVRLEAVVTPAGKLKHAEVLGGSPVLAKSAVDALEKWKWEPGPQETREVILINFHPD
jgi:TonB family protein